MTNQALATLSWWALFLSQYDETVDVFSLLVHFTERGQYGRAGVGPDGVLRTCGLYSEIEVREAIDACASTETKVAS